MIPSGYEDAVGLKHFPYHCVFVEIPNVWPFFGGAATSRAFRRMHLL
jgi:hypothetical protein